MEIAFTYIRTILYSVFLLWALLVFILAAALTGELEHDFNTYYKAGVELLVASILSFLVIPLHLLYHRRPTTSVFGSLWVEIAFLSVLFLLYLGGAAAAADQLDSAWCDALKLLFGGLSECATSDALQAFAWLAWITLLVLISFLVVTAVLEFRNGRESVWTEQYALTEKSRVPAPAATTTPQATV